MNIAKLSVLRPIAMGMVICLILILGVVSLRNLSVDLFPELTFPIVAVTASYEGAGPEEVETLLTQPIEEMMSSLPNVESVTSTSRTGAALILVSFNWGTDIDFATLGMRERIDMIRDSLPDGVPTPQVLRFDPSLFPIVQLAVTEPTGNIIEAKKITENDIKPLLDSVDGVASVTIEGGADREIQLITNPNELAAFGLTITDLQQYIGSENLNIPGGQVQDYHLNLPIRIKGQFQTIHDIRTLPVPTNQGVIPLENIVHVQERIRPASQISYLNGEPSVGLSIMKATGTNTVFVTRNINQQLEQLSEILPEGVEIQAIFDQSRFIEQSIRAVFWNMILGSFLAALVLYLFLRNFRSTLIIAFSIPISIMTTFLFMYFYGETLNLLTLGGLALGVGMMVDNAIVILENIYRLRQKGLPIKEAAIEGTREIGGAIVASTLTTVVVFLPIVFVEGLAAQLFKPLAITVAFSLAASLFTALIIVPLLSSTMLTVNTDTSSFQQGFERLTNWYRNMLRKTLNRPKTVIVSTLALLVITGALTPLLGTEFLPAQDQSFVSVDVRLAAGSSLDATYDVVSEIDDILKEIPEIDLSYVTVGGADNFAMGTGAAQSHRASYTLLLQEPTERNRNDIEISEDIRNRLANIPGTNISVSSSEGGLNENPISITLKGTDLETLRMLSDEVISLITKVEGVREPKSNFTVGNPEITVSIDRDKSSMYGLGSAQIAQAVNNATRGVIATRLAQGGEQLDVRLMVSDQYTSSLEALSQLLINTPTGERIPLYTVATVERDVGPNTIRRADRMREVTVNASIINRDLGSIVSDIETVLKEDLAPILPNGYSARLGGQREQMNDAFFKLSMAIALAVVLVYMVMAARFESLFYPFIIMFSIPITAIGIIIGLLITFQPFGVGSLIGVLILTGIVVNNAIVLVDYINTLKAKGLSSKEAIIEAGPVRLRPIMMTALTTILGLIPLTLGFGEGTEIQQPMAIVIVFGLAFATFITLLFIPALYYLFDEWREKRKHKKLLEEAEL